VIGQPDAHWGEKVSAVVVLKAGAELSAADLVAHCRILIAGYKVPKAIAFAPSLPISPTGKILKRVLRDEAWKGQDRAIG
jgi:acyl-CoA synthetase (AMP-forming)/AMP-acid ligase II